MKFRREAPRILIGAAVFVVIVAAILSNLLFTGITAAVEEKQLTLMRSIVSFNLKGAEDRAMARAAMIAALPRTRTLFAAQDRAGLVAEYQAMFVEQKEKFGVDQAQFHLPPATSFLRLHDPETFGDDLSKFRPMVVSVNRDQTPRKGFAIARSGPAMFGIVPVFAPEGKHLGTFETGIAFEGFLDAVKNAYSIEMAVFMKEEPLKEFGKGVKPGVFSDENRVGNFIRFYTTNASLFRSLVRDSDLSAPSTNQYIREAQGIPYGVVSVPLRNGAGDVLGMVVAGSDFSASRSARGRSIVWQGLIALFSVVILAGVILVVVRGVLLRPLQSMTSRIAAVASGEDPGEIPDRDRLCEELEGLAEHYDQLRKTPAKDEK